MSTARRHPRRSTFPLSNGHPPLAATVLPPSPGFDFTLHIRRVCEDMAARVEPLRHVDMGRVAIGFSQTRKPGDVGMYASLTPLRFAGGQRHTSRRGRKWTIQRLQEDGREMLYVLTFYLPRFLDLPFREKLTTVAHELWHISPEFDGDLRRFAGRCYAHSGSQERYDAQVERLVDRWLVLSPPESLYSFLEADFQALVARYGRVHGRKIPAPKLVPVK